MQTKSRASADSESPTLKVALVGYGHWGPVLAKNFGESLASIVDASDRRRKEAARNHPQVTIEASLSAILDDSQIAAVAVATPPDSHYELVSRSLEAGKHVFVEKPLTVDVAEAEALAKKATASGLTLMVDHLLTFSGAVERIREVVQSGELGQVRHLLAEREALGLFQQRADVLWDLAPHDLSILDYVLGRAPHAVRAWAPLQYDYHQPPLAATASLHLDYGEGCHAEVRVSWMAPEKRRRLAIVGDRAMLRYDALDVRPDARLSLAARGVEITDAGPNSAAQFEYRDETPRSLPHDETAPLGRELEAFFQAVATGNPISQNGPEAAVAVVRTLAGAATSLKCGGSWVELG